MKVAFVHDWLVTYRGGEKVLETLLPLYPDAPIYTLFYEPRQMPKSINSRRIIAPGWLKPLTRLRKGLLPILPAAIESLPLEQYDLIISTSSCVAKGVIPGPRARHLCYLHSPMRYVWDQREHYLKGTARIPGANGLIHLFSSRLRIWDQVSSQRVDRFIVNSQFVAERVRRYYGRESTVVHPPIEDRFFATPAEPKDKKEPYFLAVGAFVPYKRFDLAIEACRLAGKKLVVAGSGPLEKELRHLGNHATFVPSPDDAKLQQLYAGAEALLFPNVEDFGLTAIEAMSCGTPVIAFAEGGALDYVKPGETGEFFREQNAASLAAVLKNFSATQFDRTRIRDFAGKFSRQAFQERIRAQIDALMRE